MRPFVTAVLLMLALAPAAAQTVRIALRPSALAAGPRVMLAEVADGDGATALADVDLGPAPLPGYSARLTRAGIERTLRARGLRYELAAGADSVKVDRRTQAYDGRSLTALAQQQLRAALAATASRIELQAVGAPPELQLAPGKVGLSARPLPAGQPPRRRMTVWIDVAVDGVFARAVALPFQVRAYGKVLAATRDLAAGAQPDCATLAEREEDLAALDAAPLKGPCGAVEGRLKRPLAIGTPLLNAHLQAPLAVTQGDSIGLLMRDGAIVLESRATALADGNVGQRIDVRPAGATQTVRAEVVGPALVKIQ
jgi:flagella basal body P-ring formation protein FlgA